MPEAAHPAGGGAAAEDLCPREGSCLQEEGQGPGGGQEEDDGAEEGAGLCCLAGIHFASYPPNTFPGQAQLDSLRDSMSTIDLHRNTIERSMLNRTVLDSLRAAGDVLRQMGATRDGISNVEGIVNEVEEQVERAAEITKIISAGNVSGMVNTMAVDGIVIDEEELMHELDALVAEDEMSDDMKPVPLFPSVPQMLQPQHATNPVANAPGRTLTKMSKKQGTQQQRPELGGEVAMI